MQVGLNPCKNYCINVFIVTDAYIVVHNTFNIQIKDIIIGKLKLKFPLPDVLSQFPTYLPVRIISALVADVII